MDTVPSSTNLHVLKTPETLWIGPDPDMKKRPESDSNSISVLFCYNRLKFNHRELLSKKVFDENVSKLQSLP
jgi:hypothetical protein